MRGGPAARLGYKYQDHCALIYLIDGLLRGEDFETLYSEQDEIDFEIRKQNEINCFQAKSNGKMSAVDLNNLFKAFLTRRNVSKKVVSNVIIVSGKDSLQPSLKELEAVLKAKIRVYGGKFKVYCEGSMRDVNEDLNFFCYTILKKDAFNDLCKKVRLLADGLVLDKNYPASITDNLAGHLREQIDTISCKVNEAERYVTQPIFLDIIMSFLEGMGFSEETPQGPVRKFLRVDPQKRRQITEAVQTMGDKVPALKLTSPNQYE